MQEARVARRARGGQQAFIHSKTLLASPRPLPAEKHLLCGAAGLWGCGQSGDCWLDNRLVGRTL